MLDQEPLWYPSRNRFPFDPGVQDKQLWAIGMIVVQWSMLEWFIDVETRKLIANDSDLLAEYNKTRNFQETVAFWRLQTERAPNYAPIGHYPGGYHCLGYFRFNTRFVAALSFTFFRQFVTFVKYITANIGLGIKTVKGDFWGYFRGPNPPSW